MTTSNKDIEHIVDLYCNGVNSIELNKLLSKLDYEDLDVLRAIIEETQIHAVDEYETICYNEGYENGYNAGYNEGYLTEE